MSISLSNRFLSTDLPVCSIFLLCIIYLLLRRQSFGRLESSYRRAQIRGIHEQFELLLVEIINVLVLLKVKVNVVLISTGCQQIVTLIKLSMI